MIRSANDCHLTVNVLSEMKGKSHPRTIGSAKIKIVIFDPNRFFVRPEAMHPKDPPMNVIK